MSVPLTVYCKCIKKRKIRLSEKCYLINLYSVTFKDQIDSGHTFAAFNTEDLLKRIKLLTSKKKIQFFGKGKIELSNDKTISQFLSMKFENNKN